MSQHETRIKPDTHLVVGGVNQRVFDTELQPHEYSMLDGVFPDFAGAQTRLWGKRLHQKFAQSVYGIHQFWTPLGYGGGLYQFDDSIDFGPWLTPTIEIVLTPIELPIDGGNLTIEEWGTPTWQTPNTCLLSFLNGSTDHSSCNPPVVVVGVPVDNNGSPIGGGTNCRWTDDGEPTEHALAPLVVSGSNGTSGFSQLNTEPPINEPYSPVPPSRRLPQIENTKPIYANSGSVLVASASSSSNMGHVPFVGYNFRYEGNAAGGNAVIDFTPVVDMGHLPGRAELFVEHLNSVAAWEGEWIQVPIHFDGGGEIDYRYNSFKLDLWDYVVQGRVTVENGGNGYNLSDSVRVQKARFIFRVRVCT